jgi:hypothetical protein
MNWNYYLIGWIAIVAIGEFQFGYMMGELTLIKDALPCSYGYSSNSNSPITNIIGTLGPLGAAFGAVSAGYLSYKGRRKSLIFADIIVIVA